MCAQERSPIDHVPGIWDENHENPNSPRRVGRSRNLGPVSAGAATSTLVTKLSVWAFVLMLGFYMTLALLTIHLGSPDSGGAMTVALVAIVSILGCMSFAFATSSLEVRQDYDIRAGGRRLAFVAAVNGALVVIGVGVMMVVFLFVGATPYSVSSLLSLLIGATTWLAANTRISSVRTSHLPRPQRKSLNALEIAEQRQTPDASPDRNAGVQ